MTDDDDDGSPWQPVLDAHTPVSEIEELIAHWAAWSLRESVAVIDAIPNLTPDLRARVIAELEVFIPAQTRRALIGGWMRLRAGGE